MTERPDWVECIGFGDAVAPDELQTWCGGPYKPFFTDPTHAALTGMKGGRVVACPECVEAICEAMRYGHDELETPE